MQTIQLSTFMDNMNFYISEAKAGKIFVYPTDTIYGIGGITTPQVITKITSIKNRPSGKSYSIVAPSFSRVDMHFQVSSQSMHIRPTYSSQHPGRGITLLLKPKPEYRYLSSLLSENEYIWVRILSHPFQERVTYLWEWFITTSANISGNPSITSLDELTSEQKKLIDYGVDEWGKNSLASVIIDVWWDRIVRN